MRRPVTLACSLAAVVATAGGGALAGRQIRSPAEVAARTAPPIASPITVPVQQVRLSSEVVTRGTVRYSTPQAVTLGVSALKSTKSGGVAVVTALPQPGAQIAEGTTALAVSGRPVLVLQGQVPAHRDLAVGASGDDVRQLEAGLARLGFKPGPLDGAYDRSTAAAVAAWYKAAGWTPFGPTEEQLQVVRAAEAEARSAQAEIVAAEEAILTAASTERTALDRLRLAQAAAAVAPSLAAAARLKTDAEVRAAGSEVIVRTGAIRTTEDAAKVARLRLAEARKAPPEAAPAPSEIAALVAAVDDADRAVLNARAQLAGADALLAMTRGSFVLSPDLALETAAAEAGVQAAGQARRLAERRGQGARDRTSLRKAPAPLDVQVPSDEILFFPSLPVRADEVKAKVGEVVAGPVLTVTGSDLTVDAALSLEDSRLISTGAAVTITAPDLGVRGSGSVRTVATTPGTLGVDPQRFHLSVAPSDLPTSLVGGPVVLTITVQTTSGAVLAVPASALSVGADGQSRVRVLAGDGTTRFVAVVPGLAAKGLIAVEPQNGGLAAGDLVVVGSRDGAPVPVPTSGPTP